MVDISELFISKRAIGFVPVLPVFDVVLSLFCSLFGELAARTPALLLGLGGPFGSADFLCSFDDFTMPNGLQ
jgi:hypothetical protein